MDKAEKVFEKIAISSKFIADALSSRFNKLDRLSKDLADTSLETLEDYNKYSPKRRRFYNLLDKTEEQFKRMDTKRMPDLVVPDPDGYNIHKQFNKLPSKPFRIDEYTRFGPAGEVSGKGFNWFNTKNRLDNI